MLSYLRLLTNDHFRAACDYLADDRVEDCGEFLVGKCNPAPDYPESCIVVTNRTKSKSIFLDDAVKPWFNLQCIIRTRSCANDRTHLPLKGINHALYDLQIVE